MMTATATITATPTPKAMSFSRRTCCRRTEIGLISAFSTPCGAFLPSPSGGATTPAVGAGIGGGGGGDAMTAWSRRPDGSILLPQAAAG